MNSRQESGDSANTKSQRHPSGGPGTRKIDYRHSARFVPILEHLGCSLLISTYAAGKVVSVGAEEGKLRLGFSNFQQAMGIAPPYREAAGSPGNQDSIAVGGPNVIWFLRDGGTLASQVEPAGRYERVYLARESFVTGNIHVHEMRWGADGQLWVVNTLFSCLSTLHEDFNFVPRWQPPFISELMPEDRCHLNGMAMVEGQPKYVSALGVSNAARGWRENKASGGVVMEVPSGAIVADGFCMPHSPRCYQGKLYLLDSGRGRLVTIDPRDGVIDEVTSYPGYGRGLAFHRQFAFVAMSRARETSVFGGVPICSDRDAMRCGVVVVDLTKGQCIAFLEFESGVEELFDVQVIEGSKRTVLCGPYPREDEQSPVWVVPRSEQVTRLVSDATGDGVARKQIE